ncbi:hypothetical protein BH10ACI3_BH10ACI3_14610 [soil metagenome]
MTSRELKEYRKNCGLTQEQASRRLSVSQTYLSLLESGERPLTTELKRKVVRVFNLRSTELPAQMTSYKVTKTSDDQLTSDLATLGYAGFSYWTRSPRKNPADVLLSALSAAKRDARLVEALPWIVLTFPDMDWNGLAATARLHDLQNRLGFVTNVARQVAESRGDDKTAKRLNKVELTLEPSRLEREDTLCNETMTNAERKWLAAERPESAKRWHLLTDLSPRYLNHYE